MIEDTLPANWILADLTCVSDLSSSSYTTTLNTRTADINLAPGDSITCIFTNTNKGTIIIEKATDPASDPQVFTFTTTLPGGPSPFTLNTNPGPVSQTFVIPSGNYTVEEDDPAPLGWDLTGLTCEDPDGGDSSGDTGTRIATINVAAGETVTCVFTNTKLAVITITKVTDPAPDPSLTTFSFTAIGGLTPANFNLQNGDTQSFSAVSPGTYEVTETVPSGWSLTSSCDNGNPIDNIAVAAGDQVTCVFTNTRLATVTIEKVTDPDPDPEFDDVFLYGDRWVVTGQL